MTISYVPLAINQVRRIPLGTGVELPTLTIILSSPRSGALVKLYHPIPQNDMGSPRVSLPPKYNMISCPYCMHHA